MDWFNDLGPVEWFRQQFVDPSAWSIFRLMLLSWAVAGATFIGLDRLSSLLLGRSRPLAQEPPALARTWRWGRQAPPETYSLLPAGTTVQATVPTIAAPVLLERPLGELTAGGPVTPRVQIHDPSLPMDDPTFWRLFSKDTAPVFGFENETRLGKGDSPERYNPVTGRVESLERIEAEGILLWPWQSEDPHIVGPD